MKNKKSYWIAGIILLIFIVTNPSQKAFKEYLGSNTYRGLRRTSNLFLFSIYDDGDRYFAILGNFYELHTDPFKPYGGHELTQEEIDSSNMADSAKMKMADTNLLPPPPPKKVDEYGIPIKKSMWRPPAKDKLVDTTDWSRYEIQDPLNLMSLPYKERVYWALRDNVEDFYFTRAEFYSQLKNPNFQVEVYNLLKLHLNGFTKTQSEFLQKLNQN